MQVNFSQVSHRKLKKVKLTMGWDGTLFLKQLIQASDNKRFTSTLFIVTIKSTAAFMTQVSGIDHLL